MKREFKMELQQNLQSLSERAEEIFGSDAYFTYLKGTEAYTLTLEEAIQICGPHISTVTTEMAIKMLESMHIIAEVLNQDALTNPDSARRFEESVTRGKTLLAQYVISRTS